MRKLTECLHTRCKVTQLEAETPSENTIKSEHRDQVPTHPTIVVIMTQNINLELLVTHPGAFSWTWQPSR